MVNVDTSIDFRSYFTKERNQDLDSKAELERLIETMELYRGSPFDNKESKKGIIRKKYIEFENYLKLGKFNKAENYILTLNRTWGAMIDTIED